MSYFENISLLIDNEISSLLKNISTKYNLDEKEMIEMWKTQKSNSERKQPATVPVPVPVVDNQLLKLGRGELVEMCKTKGLKVGGTKNELATRIQQFNENKTNNIFKTSNGSESKTVSAPTSTGNAVINKLVEKIPVIEIKKNKFGNYEHSDSSLIFDNKTHKAYGKQNSDGTISKLTKDDIDTCNKYKFSYVLPDNLDDDEDEEVEYEEEVVEGEEEEEEEEEEVDDDEEEEEEEEIELEEDYE